MVDANLRDGSCIEIGKFEDSCKVSIVVRLKVDDDIWRERRDLQAQYYRIENIAMLSVVDDDHPSFSSSPHCSQRFVRGN